MKYSVRWYHQLKIRIEPAEEWAPIPAFEFDGYVSFPALPREKMRISTLNDLADDAEISEVYAEMSRKGFIGFRIIINSSHGIYAESLDEAFADFITIMQEASETLAEFGLICKGLGFDREFFDQKILPYLK